MDIPQQHVNIGLPTQASLLSRVTMSPAGTMSKPLGNDYLANLPLGGSKLPLAVHPLMQSETGLLQTIGLANLARNLPASVTVPSIPNKPGVIQETSGHQDKKRAFKKVNQVKRTTWRDSKQWQRYSYKPVAVMQKTTRPLRPLPPPPSLVSLEQFQRMKVNLSKS